MGTSLGADLLYMGPCGYTCPNHMDILCRIFIYFGPAVVAVFLHLTLDKDIVFIVKDLCVLKEVVEFLVELE